MHKMTARRVKADQILGPVLEPGELLRLIIYLANLKFPSEVEAATEATMTETQKADFIKRLRERTQKYWSGLWTNEEQAYRVLERMQSLLRRFWGDQDGHARDWYIHRARHLVQRLRVQREMGDQFQQKFKTVNDVLKSNAKIEDLLDNPPVRVLFEDALYQLQRRAPIPSKRPLRCPNCQRYFLSEKKGTKFCSPECARPSLLASKRTYAKQGKRQRRTQ
jgi:hypothetical protein